MSRGSYRLINILLLIIIASSSFALGAYCHKNKREVLYKYYRSAVGFIKHDDIKESARNEKLGIVEIPSSIDKEIQKAYFYDPNQADKAPLIVSLHTWGGNYSGAGDLSELAILNNWAYIHPDFRGPNNTEKACCSEYVISDIDDAIDYAMQNSNIDKDRIYVVGFSGGGYTALCAFMKSKHKINKFSAWASISDLVAWYDELKIGGFKAYTEDILRCTNSDSSTLNIETAKERSPIFWETPKEKLEYAKVEIYAGIYDGIQGSVPITHSINFYNKILSDLNVASSSTFVTDKEKLFLLEKKKALGEEGALGRIGERNIVFKKEYNNLKLIIFEGNHEILSEYAFYSLK